MDQTRERLTLTLYIVDQSLLIINEVEVGYVDVVPNQRYENQNGAEESEEAQDERSRGNFTTEAVPHRPVWEMFLKSGGNLFHC